MQRFLNQIIHGDCLQILPEIPNDSVDAVITDPPYSSGGLTSGERSADPAKKYVQTGTKITRPSFTGDNRDQRSWAFWCCLWISECMRIIKPSGYFMMFTDWRQLPLSSDVLQAGGIVWRGIVTWDKTEGARAPHTGYFRHQAEYVVWGTKGVSKPSAQGGPRPGVFRFPVRQKDKHHITGKPTPLMTELVQIVPPGAVVLDPFAGSGTTAVACLNTGRQFIGIEKETAYAEIAQQRIAEAQKAPL